MFKVHVYVYTLGCSEMSKIQVRVSFQPVPTGSVSWASCEGYSDIHSSVLLGGNLCPKNVVSGHFSVFFAFLFISRRSV